jgi:hypothetical protein
LAVVTRNFKNAIKKLLFFFFSSVIFMFFRLFSQISHKVFATLLFFLNAESSDKRKQHYLKNSDLSLDLTSVSCQLLFCVL